MINLLLGAPGSGKSYEAVAYHVIPALLEGRAVVTNLPLNVDAISSLVPNVSSLLFLIHPNSSNTRPFSRIEDFSFCAWRDEQTNRGPLYVIDECHMSFPRGETPRAIEEWFAMHRHYGVDVLLITQSYRKLSVSIVDLVQTVYRVRKNIALGSDKSYVRKVQDGVRGEVVNTSVRKYNPKFFKYYISHTFSNSSVIEASAKDVKGIWSHWSFKLLIILFVFFIYWTSTHNVNPFPDPDEYKGINSSSPKIQKPVQAAEFSSSSMSSHISSLSPSLDSSFDAEPKKQVDNPINEKPFHPFNSVTLHISGYIKSGKRQVYHILAAYNAQPSFVMTSDDLIQAGYDIHPITECLLSITYNHYTYYLTCDGPKVGFNVAGVQASQQSPIEQSY